MTLVVRDSRSTRDRNRGVRDAIGNQLLSHTVPYSPYSEVTEYPFSRG